MPRGLPAVLLNTPEQMMDRPSMAIDNRAGAAAVARHLIDLGRRHLVHIAGPDHNVDARERREGFEDAVRTFAPDATVAVLPGDFNEDTGELAAKTILSKKMKVDAIFAANDMMAVGCLQALRAAGRRVPEEIAVAGFDDVPIARYLSLTTARVNIAELGARAVIRLTEIMDTQREPHQGVEVHKPELVIRGTTAR
jgi:LacI family transcriptional regulator